MKTVKITKKGDSQSVNLPGGYQFNESDVYINKIDNIVILFSRKEPWSPLIMSLEKFSDDFMENRNQPPQQKRDA